MVTWACLLCVPMGGKQEFSAVAGAWLDSNLACVSHCLGNTLCRWRHTPLPGPRAKKTKAPGAKATGLICKSLILFSCLLKGALTLAQSLSRHNSSIFFTDKLRDQVNLACLTVEAVLSLRYDQLEYIHTMCVYLCVWMQAYIYNYI